MGDQTISSNAGNRSFSYSSSSTTNTTVNTHNLQTTVGTGVGIGAGATNNGTILNISSDVYAIQGMADVSKNALAATTAIATSALVSNTDVTKAGYAAILDATKTGYVTVGDIAKSALADETALSIEALKLQQLTSGHSNDVVANIASQSQTISQQVADALSKVLAIAAPQSDGATKELLAQGASPLGSGGILGLSPTKIALFGGVILSGIGLYFYFRK